VDLLIKEGAEINYTSFEPRVFTPVMAAAVAGHADVVQFLIDHGADLTIRNGDGDTVLEAAMTEGHADTTAVLLEVLGGDYYPQQSVALDIAIATSHAAIKSIMVNAGLIYSHINLTIRPSVHLRSIQRVLEEGGDLVKPRAMSNMMHVALYDGELDVVVRLLARGYDPDQHLSSGQTPLHVAVSQNNIPLLEVLLKCGADPAIQACSPDDLMYTPLHQALIALDNDIQRDTTIVDLLIESKRCKLMAGPDAHSNAFAYVLSHYSTWDHGVAEIMTFRMLQFVEDINDDRSDDGSTMMHAAVWHGRTDLIDILLSKGADIDATDFQGRTPFLLECQRSKRLLRFLLSKGADPHAKDAQSQSALHAASAYGNIPITTFLLNIGLPINQPDDSNYTPLTLAILSNQEDAALVLLTRGATIPLHTITQGRSILHLASILPMKTLIPRLLLVLLTNKTTQINAKDNLGWTPLGLACQKGSAQLIKDLLDAGADMEARNHAGDTPLHIALQAGNLLVARVLCFLGASVVVRGGKGQTALHVAARCGNVHVVQVLVDHGAEAGAVDDAGRTALCGAFDPGIARVLMESGADVRHVDGCGWTALHCAVERGNVDVCRVLVEAGGELEARTGDDGRSVREMMEGW
jgi:ankyrin repeat protein